MRAWLVLLLLSILSQAEPAPRKVKINELGRAAELSYRLFDGTRWGAWTPLGPAGVGTTQVELPEGQGVLRATARDGLWIYQGEQGFRSGTRELDMPPLTRHLDFGLVALLLAGLGVAGALAVVRWRRRTLAGLELSNEPLIRSDGQVPRRLIGTYRPVSVLGSGGMGVVYKALASDGLPVAIKVPTPQLAANPEFRGRYRREVELGMRLCHPRVVRVLELPLGDDPYLVLEFLEGRTLEDCPALPWAQEVKRVARWADEALDALEYIHAQGVVHRDLKPANLMVLSDDSLKLMDFGIAHKVLGTQLTAEGDVLGTPIYMAPEQLQGLPIDGRADLYSLGLILFQRLAGGLPVPEETMQLLQFKLSSELPPITQLVPEAPAWWERFLRGLVARDPEERFPDAATARKELQQARV